MKRSRPSMFAAMVTIGLLASACGTDDGDSAPADDPAPVGEPGSAPTTSTSVDPADEGDDDPDLREPQPITVAARAPSGYLIQPGSAESVPGGGGAAGSLPAAPGDVEFVDGLELPANNIGDVFDASFRVTSDDVERLADQLGVDGQPTRSADSAVPVWQVGEDASSPTLVVVDDARGVWTYSGPWDPSLVTRPDCVVSSDEGGGQVAEDCEGSEPPAGVPSADEAETLARTVLESIGVDPAEFEVVGTADEWSARVEVTDRSGAQGDWPAWTLTFAGGGELQFADGSLGTPERVGPFPLIDLDEARERLENPPTFGPAPDLAAVTGLVDTSSEPAQSNDSPDLSDASDSLQPADPDDPDTPVDIPEAGEPDPASPNTTELESVPVEPISASTTTIVDVDADWWWATDTDGNVWALPAYRFIADDGAWYVVPAVTDEALIFPLQPADDTPPDPPPLDPPTDNGLLSPDERRVVEASLGSSLDEFTQQLEQAGLTVRVVEDNGEALAVTEDFAESRVNVAIETREGTEVVIRATDDAGTDIASLDVVPPGG